MEHSQAEAQAGRSAASVVETLNRTKENLGGIASDAMDAAASDLERLRADLDGPRQTLTTFLAQGSEEAIRSARDVSASLADAGSNLAASAAETGKGLAGELEDMARRNPLGALAGALVLGILIGAWGRGRGR